MHHHMLQYICLSVMPYPTAWLKDVHSGGELDDLETTAYHVFWSLAVEMKSRRTVILRGPDELTLLKLESC